MTDDQNPLEKGINTFQQLKSSIAPARNCVMAFLGAKKIASLLQENVETASQVDVSELLATVSSGSIDDTALVAIVTWNIGKGLYRWAESQHAWSHYLSDWSKARSTVFGCSTWCRHKLLRYCIRYTARKTHDVKNKGMTHIV